MTPSMLSVIFLSLTVIVQERLRELTDRQDKSESSMVLMKAVSMSSSGDGG